MKKILSLSIVSLCIAAVFTSCGSANEGLISKKWTLTSVYGTEKLNEFIGEASIDLSEGDSFKSNWIKADEEGNLALSEDSGTWILNEEGIPEEEGIADLMLFFERGNSEIMTVQHLSEERLILVYAGIELTYE